MELLRAGTVTVVEALTLEQSNHAISVFPTLSEAHLKLLDTVGL